MNNNYNNENNGVNNNTQMGYNPNNLNQNGNNLGTISNQSNNYVNSGQVSSSPVTNPVNNNLNAQQNLNSGVVNNSQVGSANTNASQIMSNTGVQSNNINNNTQYVNSNMNSQVQQNTITNDKFCGKCGTKLLSTDVFCGVCGERVNNVKSQTNNRPLVDNYYTNQSNNNYYDDEELRRAYIGNKYSAFKDGGVSWVACLFGPMYLIYRKMYLFGFIWIVVANILSIFLPKIYAFLYLPMMIFMLIKFKSLYLKHVDKKIEDIKNNNRSMNGNQLLDLCFQKGGTNIGLVIGAYIVSFVLSIIIYTPIIMGIIDDSRNEESNNDYEENNNYYEEDNESGNNISSNTVTFQGFKFNKVRGYNYEEEEGQLNISNDNYFMTVAVANLDYSYIKNSIEELKQRAKDDGVVLSGGQVETKSGREFVTFDFVNNGMNIIMYYTKGSDGYIIGGALADKNNSTSHSKLSELTKVLEGITYVGGYYNYSKDFGTVIDLNNIEY